MVYLVDNPDEEHLSDKHKISLFDDSKFEVEPSKIKVGELSNGRRDSLCQSDCG